MYHVTSEMSSKLFQMSVTTTIIIINKIIIIKNNIPSVPFKTKFNGFEKVYTIELLYLISICINKSIMSLSSFKDFDK